jgi:hypothetical protein
MYFVCAMWIRVIISILMLDQFCDLDHAAQN